MVAPKRPSSGKGSFQNKDTFSGENVEPPTINAWENKRLSQWGRPQRGFPTVVNRETRPFVPLPPPREKNWGYSR